MDRAEEVWRDARGANAARYAECFRAGIRASWAGEADQAAASVIRTAMEAYAAEKVAEERAAIVAWLRETWRTDMGEIECLDIADAITANQHHGGNDG